MLFALVVVAGLVIWLWLERKRELFLVSVRNGKVLLVRGRLPGTLMADIKAIVASQPEVRWGSVKAYRDSHRARIATNGIDEFREQRLRNIFAVYPMSNLVGAPPLNERTVGQVLGIAWLAWLLDRSLDS
jgi:hypothetical protein